MVYWFCISNYIKRIQLTIQKYCNDLYQTLSVWYICNILRTAHRIFLANPLFSRAHKNYTKHLFILRGPDILGLFCHVINTSIHIGKKFYSVRNISSVFLRYNYYYFLFCAFTYIFMHTHTYWERKCVVSEKVTPTPYG